ncbi:NTP transferase domain-containing protein [Streptomyces sp. NPDC092296]|uniref:phosphocholine cytidylyltransferase family protein n=1 Tax=Streptomyces sp. NPDC092296 TaxID=3366012 RepID=UPI0038078102
MTDRRAVLLCAGRGTRARGITEGQPKCLIQVGGRTLLSRMLSQLIANGVDDVHVVVGYEADQILKEVGDRATLHYYEGFERTNNLWTLAANADLLRGRDCAVLFGDVIVSDQAVADLWSGLRGVNLLVDQTSRLAGTMRVRRAGDGVVEMGNHIAPAESDGNYVGLMTVRAGASDALADAVREEMLAGRGQDAYFTTVIEGISASVPVSFVDVASGSWAEIDDGDDYLLAKQRFE